MKAFELLDSPEKWCRNHMAEDADGRVVPPDRDTAVKWCAAGALIRAYGWERVHSAFLYAAFAAPIREFASTRMLDVYGLTDFNDHPQVTHSDVIALLKSSDV